MVDLAFYTSEQLVSELLGRTTLVGVVIRSEDEAGKVGGHRNFLVEFTPNLNPTQVIAILDGLLDQLKAQ
jgi:hypothetical protein